MCIRGLLQPNSASIRSLIALALEVSKAVQGLLGGMIRDYY